MQRDVLAVRKQNKFANNDVRQKNNKSLRGDVVVYLLLPTYQLMIYQEGRRV